MKKIILFPVLAIVLLLSLVMVTPVLAATSLVLTIEATPTVITSGDTVEIEVTVYNDGTISDGTPSDFYDLQVSLTGPINEVLTPPGGIYLALGETASWTRTIQLYDPDTFYVEAWGHSLTCNNLYRYYAQVSVDVIPGDGDEGLTPGYWKNHLDAWADTGYATDDDFDTVFGVDAFDPDITLLDALKLKGGGLKALARHATAALLNVGDPDIDYPYSYDQVISMVQNAISSGDYEAVKDYLDEANNQGNGD